MTIFTPLAVVLISFIVGLIDDKFNTNILETILFIIVAGSPLLIMLTAFI